jgi:hypothetical protein
MKARLSQSMKAFGHFWWDFLIGDTPEFAVATLLIVGLAYALRHDHVAAAILLPLLTAVFLLASTLRGRRRVAEPTPAPTLDEPGHPGPPPNG